MKLIIQRVASAHVSTEASGIIGQIGKGLCIFIGIGEGDGDNEVRWCKDMILNTKLWEDPENKPWKKNIKDLDLQVLLVSQFTLYGKMYKKGKLDFHHAMAPTEARELYNSIIDSVQQEIGVDRTQTGEFGALMQVRESLKGN